MIEKQHSKINFNLHFAFTVIKRKSVVLFGMEYFADHILNGGLG